MVLKKIPEVPCRYMITVLAFFGLGLLYTMRANLSVAILAIVKKNLTLDTSNINESYPNDCPIKNNSFVEESHRLGEKDWNQVQVGVILSAFFYGYVFANFFCGRLPEVIGSKWTFGGGVLCTTVLTLLTPVVVRWNYNALVVLRVLAGVGEGVTYPAFHIILGRWIPKKERGFICSLIQSGAKFGAIIGEALSGVLCQSYFLDGWPMAFYVFGLSGVIWCILWWILMFEWPEMHPRISNEERIYLMEALLEEGHLQKKVPVPWKRVMTSLPVWVAIFALFGSFWFSNFVLLAVPQFMNSVLHFNIAQTGFVASAPGVIGVIMGLVAAAVGDWILEKKLMRITPMRKIFTAIAAGCYLVSTLAIIAAGCNGDMIVMISVLGALTSSLSSAGFVVAMVDISPTFAGTIMGIGNGIAQTTGFIVPLVVGAVTEGRQALHQWHILLYLNIAVFCVPALVFVFFGTADLQPWSGRTKNSETENSDITSQRTVSNER